MRSAALEQPSLEGPWGKLSKAEFPDFRNIPKKGALPPSLLAVGPDDQIRVSLICPCLYRLLWAPVLERLGHSQARSTNQPPGLWGREQTPYLLLRVHHSQFHLLQVGGGEGHVVVNNARHQRGWRLILCRNNKRKLLSVCARVEGGGTGGVGVGRWLGGCLHEGQDQ